MTTACMGGFKCPLRDRCAHYHVEGITRHHQIPSESLCSAPVRNSFLPLLTFPAPSTSPIQEAA